MFVREARLPPGGGVNFAPNAVACRVPTPHPSPGETKVVTVTILSGQLE